MDLEIRNLKNKVISDLNEAVLPMEVKRLVLAEILRDVSAYADQVIAEQISQNDKEE